MPTWTAPGRRRPCRFGHNVFNEQEVELFEYIDYEWEDPETGEEVFVLVDHPFRVGLALLGRGSPPSILIDAATATGCHGTNRE